MADTSVFLAWTSDDALRLRDQARDRNDLAGMRRLADRLAHGNELWVSFAQRVGGELLEQSGDQGTIRVPARSLGDLPGLMRQYEGLVEGTVSVGAGDTPARAARALEAARIQGGDRALAWSEAVEQTLAREERSAGAGVADQVVKAEPLARAESDLPRGQRPRSCARCGHTGLFTLKGRDGRFWECHQCKRWHLTKDDSPAEAPDDHAPPEVAGAAGEGLETTPPPAGSSPAGARSLADEARDVASLHVAAQQAEHDGRARDAAKARERLATMLRGLHARVTELTALGQHAPGVARVLGDLLGAIRDYAGTLPRGAAPPAAPAPGADPDAGPPVGPDPDKEPLDKGIGGAEAGRAHLNLPVGSEHNGKVKVQHSPEAGGHASWVSVRSGIVQSEDGHAASALHPGAR